MRTTSAKIVYQLVHELLGNPSENMDKYRDLIYMLLEDVREMRKNKDVSSDAYKIITSIKYRAVIWERTKFE